MRSSIRSLVLSLLATTLLPLTLPAKEIIFLAGPKDHGWPGRHDYEKDLQVLADSLVNAENLAGITTKVHAGPAPRDLAYYENAAAIVINSSSDRSERETHPLFPPNPTTSGTGYDDETAAFLVALDELIAEKQIGVVVLHYSLWAENHRARSYYMKWIGGLWVQQVGRNPVENWTMMPEVVGHPILNGVKPFTYRDEVFSRFSLPSDPRRTDLLRGWPGEDRLKIGAQITGWAYQRDDGGRGFAYGGVDFHDNMNVDDYRRFLTNGIAWVAHLDVPAEGIVSPNPGIPEFVQPQRPPRPPN